VQERKTSDTQRKGRDLNIQPRGSEAGLGKFADAGPCERVLCIQSEKRNLGRKKKTQNHDREKTKGYCRTRKPKKITCKENSNDYHKSNHFSVTQMRHTCFDSRKTQTSCRPRGSREEDSKATRSLVGTLQRKGQILILTK